MIIQEIANDRPMTGFGIACVNEPTNVEIPKIDIIADVNICECDWVEIVYLEENRTVISQVVSNSDTLDFFLVKDGVEYDLNDNTYGTFYDFGSLENHPTKKGYILDFQKIKDELGFGKYKVITRKEFLGQSSESESHYYKIETYSLENAKKYILLETYQNGIIDGLFNYSGLNWYQAIRLQGFAREEIELEVDNVILDETYQREIFKGVSKISESYILDFVKVPSSVSDLFLKNGILADSIIFTSYDYTSFKKYDSIEIVPVESPTINTYVNHKYADIQLKVRNKRDGYVKRR